MRYYKPFLKGEFIMLSILALHRRLAKKKYVVAEGVVVINPPCSRTFRAI